MTEGPVRTVAVRTGLRHFGQKGERIVHYYETERPCIDYFREEYEFLSNFYPSRLSYDGETYCNAEAAYQAHKCADPADRKAFVLLSADEAKRNGQKVALRPDWEQVKLPIMEAIVRAKFVQNPELAQYLLETGDKPLKQGNYWGDLYWGVDLKTGEGENHLGQILMALRAEFRERGIPASDIRAEIMPFGPVHGMTVLFDDITQSDCECIVNAANETLLGGGGVDGAIHRAAGKELLEACKLLGGCEPGDAKITMGYRLKARYVIHTVGPRYGVENAEALLRQSYLRCMELAREHDIHSIAFPAISAGKFSYPKKEATRVAAETVLSWLRANPDYDIRVAFTCVDHRIYECFRDALRALDA